MSNEEFTQREIYCQFCNQKLDISGVEAFSMVPCPKCSEELLIPRWLGDFQLFEPLREGGMAQVYKAKDLTLERTVAVKIPSVRISEDSQLVRDFLEEARAAAAVNHPNVVSIFSCEIDQGEPLLVMEYMSGGSLDLLIEEKGGEPFNEKEALDLILQAARGLDAAFREGIVHHDVKPGNMLLDNEGNVKVTDFGLAQLLQGREDSGISEKHAWGSPYYMSPEKARGTTEDFRGDMYSLGATLHNLLSGRPPFDCDDTSELIQARLKQDPPDPKELNPEVSQRTAEFVFSLMAREPRDRPSDYRKVIESLEKARKAVVQGRRGNKSRSTGLHQVQQRATDIYTHTALRDHSRWKRSKQVLNIIILLGLIGLGALCARAALQGAPWLVRFAAGYEQITPGWMNIPVGNLVEKNGKGPSETEDARRRAE